MSTRHRVNTGRKKVGRIDGPDAFCHVCTIRRTVGEPKESVAWTGRLHNNPLTEEQMDLLLVAAAEFRALSLEADEVTDAVAFVDWLRPDALGKVSSVYPEADGAPPRFESGTARTHGDQRAHRHPDPLPVLRRAGYSM